MTSVPAAPSGLLFDVGPEQTAATSGDWYTPRWLFDAAGLVFDMDVCAPVNPAYRTCPATEYLTVIEDGLTAPWSGLVWMNPPYANSRPWVERFAEHGCGLALLPTLKGRSWTGTLLRCADAITLLTMTFGRPDGTSAEIPTLLILAACGDTAAKALTRVAAVDRYAQGAYHVKAPDAAG